MLTINGKPFTEKRFQDEMEKEMVRAIAEDTEKHILSLLTPSEASKLKIDLVGNDLENLSVDVDGPDEIVEKVRKALGEDEPE